MIARRRVDELLETIGSRRILVAGDLILDRYLFGRVERISPEAPVPVLHVQREENRPGGAGNVAANILGLGGNIVLSGIVGDDEPGRTLRALIPGQDRVITDPGLPTVTKTRVISQRQQIVRIDREETNAVFSPATAERLLRRLDDVAVDGILVSDYAKGAVTSDLMEKLRDLAASLGIPLVVDPKPVNAVLYRGVTGMTPNLTESEALLGESVRTNEEAARAARRLQGRFKCRFVAVTRGENGITAAETRHRAFHVPARAQEVYDVTGAGDTVAAVLVLALSAGASLRESVIMANAAASLVVEKVGTARVSPMELRQRLLSRDRTSGL